MSASLTPRQWRSLLTLSGELVEILDDDPGGAASYLLASLHRMTGSDEGYLIFNRKVESLNPAADPLRGWRPVYTGFDRRPEEHTRVVSEWMSDPRRLLRDVPTQRLARTVGRPRALSRAQLTKGVAPGGTTSEDLFQALDVSDVLHGGTGLEPDLDLVIGLNRVNGRGRFAPEALEILGAVVHHMPWFFRRLADRLGIRHEPPHLSPREETTLEELLTGRTEKVIARDLGISHNTLHQYVKSLYKKLAVNSRGELMALALEGGLPLPVGNGLSIPYGSPRGVSMRVAALSDSPEAEEGDAAEAAEQARGRP